MENRLFVGNLSFQISEHDLEEAFKDFGGANGNIPVTEAGRSRGFGFVDVDEDKLEEAITRMNGVELNGREITVNKARPRETRPTQSWG